MDTLLLLTTIQRWCKPIEDITVSVHMCIMCCVNRVTFVTLNKSGPIVKWGRESGQYDYYKVVSYFVGNATIKYGGF